MIGYFHTVLPLVYVAEAAQSSAHAFRAMHSEFVQALQHSQAVAFQEIVSAVSPARSSGYSPLCQASLVYHAAETIQEDRAAYAQAANGGTEAAATEPAKSGVEHARALKVSFDLAIYFMDGTGGELEGVAGYDGAIFSALTARAMMARFACMIRGVANTPEGVLSQVSIMPEAEAARVLWRFNDTGAAWPTEACVHELVGAQAARTPAGVALEWAGATLTYAALQGCACAVGAWLAAHGACADRVVALELHRSLEQVVGVAGSLASDGAYLPLDVKWPVERRRFMVADASSDQLMAQGAFDKESQLCSCGVALLLEGAQLPHAPPATAWQRTSSHQLAYVMYTSGSTGQPKGVIAEHACVVNLVGATRQRFPADSGWVCGVSTAYVFDVFVHVAFSTLAVRGASCWLIEDAMLSLIHI